MRAPAVVRFRGLDRLRGLAILLMVVDHALALTGVGLVVRLTLTRAAAPIFMATAGALPSKNSRRRWLGLVGVAAVETVLCSLLGLQVPAIVLVLVVVQPVFLWARSIGIPAVVLVLVGWWQSTFAPLPIPGYEPGFVLMWLAVGSMCALDLNHLGRRLPALAEAIGRRPRSWYLGHLAAFVPMALLTV